MYMSIVWHNNICMSLLYMCNYIFVHAASVYAHAYVMYVYVHVRMCRTVLRYITSTYVYAYSNRSIPLSLSSVHTQLHISVYAYTHVHAVTCRYWCCLAFVLWEAMLAFHLMLFACHCPLPHELLLLPRLLLPLFAQVPILLIVLRLISNFPVLHRRRRLRRRRRRRWRPWITHSPPQLLLLLWLLVLTDARDSAARR